MKASRDVVKILIEMSPNVNEADKVINEYYGFESIREKVAFLKGMFDIEIVGHKNDEPDEMTYYAMLHTIISI